MRPSLIVHRAADYLARHDVGSPLPTAEILLASVLGTDRAGLYARDEGLSTTEAKRFGRALCQRCVGVPLQHLTGEEGFRRLILTVRPGVFIPRPETEILVERALDVISGRETPLVVDVGTGTGAIALAIKDERADAVVLAIDLSPEAVALARDNAVRTRVDIDVLRGDLLEPLPAGSRGAIDLVVSNPPYIEDHEFGSLPPEVRADPLLALVGGVQVYERLFTQASEALRPGGWVAVEIGETQAAAVSAVATRAGFERVDVGRDLSGRDRIVTARKPA